MIQQHFVIDFDFAITQHSSSSSYMIFHSTSLITTRMPNCLRHNVRKENNHRDITNYYTAGWTGKNLLRLSLSLSRSWIFWRIQNSGIIVNLVRCSASLRTNWMWSVFPEKSKMFSGGAFLVCLGVAVLCGDAQGYTMRSAPLLTQRRKVPSYLFIEYLLSQ